MDAVLCEAEVQALLSRSKCPGCGYGLAGLRTLRCPECGRVLSVKELLERERPRRRVIGPVVGMCGANAFLWAAAWISMVVENSGDGQAALIFLAPMFATAITIAVVVAGGALVLTRRAWTTQEGTSWLVIASVLWGVMMGALSVLMMVTALVERRV